MAALLLLAVLAAAPNVSIDGTAEGVIARVQAWLALEVGDLDLPASSTDRSMHFTIDRTDGELWIEGPEGRRRLGRASNPAAAARVAGLVIARHLRAGRARAVTEPPSLPLRVAPPALQASPRLSLAEAPPPAHRWRVEAAATVALAPVSGSADIGATAAAHYRLFDQIFIGARAVGASMCCAPTPRANVRLSGGILVAVLEVAVDRSLGPVTLRGALGAGLSSEWLDAQIVDLFAGPTAPERRWAVSFAARAGLAVSWPLGPHAALFARVGARVRPGPTRVQLPAPYDAGQPPVGRRAVSPITEAGLSLEF